MEGAGLKNISSDERKQNWILILQEVTVGNRNETENMIPFLEKGYKGQQTKKKKIRRRGDESLTDCGSEQEIYSLNTDNDFEWDKDSVYNTSNFIQSAYRQYNNMYNE